MAASGLCYNAAKFLIDRGSDPTLINNKVRVYTDLLPRVFLKIGEIVLKLNVTYLNLQIISFLNAPVH